MAWNTYHNPKTVTIGSIVYGVVSVGYTVAQAEVHGAADGDTHESLARFTTKSTRGAIVFLDPEEAKKASGSTGTLTYVAQDVKGSTDITVTVATVSMGGYDFQVSRDSVAACTVPFVAEAEPSIE